MEQIRSYLLSVCTAAMICAIARRLLERKGSVAAMGKLLIGLFMTFTVLSPLTELSIGPVRDITNDFYEEAQQAAQTGVALSQSALRDGIKERTEEYIIEKAQAMGANIRVQVFLTDDVYPAPCKVHLSGDISPYARRQLQQVIAQLGVTEENQIWT